MKKILCIFTDNEGSSALDYYLRSNTSIFSPGFELLDKCHQPRYSDFKKNESEYFKALYGYNTSFNYFELQNGLFKYHKNSYINIINKHKYIYFKYRMPEHLYHLINETSINYIILPIRYDFNRILGRYIKTYHNIIYQKYSQFTRCNLQNDNIIKYIDDKVDIHESMFNNIYIEHEKYLMNFIIKYNKLKKYNAKILIFNYNNFKENNIEYLKKIYNILNIPTNNIPYKCFYTPLKISYIEFFNKRSQNIIYNYIEKYNYIKYIFENYINLLTDCI